MIRRFLRAHPVPSGLFLAYMVGFTAYAVAGGNREFLFYGAVMVLLGLAVAAFDARVKFSKAVVWGLSVWGLVHMAGGNVPIPARLAPDWSALYPARVSAGEWTVLYNLRPGAWVPKYDQVVHAYGFFVATLASFEAIRAAVGGSVRIGVGFAVALACMGMGLGAANEVVEFAATRLMSTNVGGYENTGWDLVSNGGGGGGAGGLGVGEGGEGSRSSRLSEWSG